MISITNIVGGVDFKLNGYLPLEQLANTMAHVRIRAVWPRILIKQVRTAAGASSTLLLYPSGHLSICGCKSVRDMKRVGRQFTAMLKRRVGYLFSSKQTFHFRVKTISAKCKLDISQLQQAAAAAAVQAPRSLALAELARRLANSSCEPELFSALIVKNLNCKFLIFHTGSIIICGARSTKQLE
jgi:TATA-box binding protein (TBP) (component of TFIID and TFIIIB)